MKLMARSLIKIFTLFFVVIAAAPVLGESVVHRGNRGEPDTLDPHKTANGWEAAIALELYTGLTAFSATGQVLPALAERWDVSEDGQRK